MDVYNDPLRQRYSLHKFIVSPVGILKLVGSILSLTSSLLSVGLKVCHQTTWLEISFPILVTTSSVLILLLYALTILGIPKKIPKLWTRMEIIISTLVVIVTLVFSILLLTNCNNKETSIVVTGVISIIGTVCLAVSALIIFIYWTSDDDVEVLPRPPDTAPEDFDPKRKSVFI